jgi:inner membrane protein
MSPVTHFLGSWLVASVATRNPRDRLLVTLAGALPDADGLGMILDLVGPLVSGKETTFHYYQQYHHMLLHGWPGAVAVALLLTAFARERPRVMLWCLIMFHLHLFCDLIGSRGPDIGDLWPICYSEPVFRHPIWFWKGQWRLDGWQNQLVCFTVLGLALWFAVKRGYSFVRLFSQRADAVFVRVLRQWFGGLQK